MKTNRKIDSYFVYILQSSHGKYYTGYTNNLEKRMKTHQEGKGSKFIRAFGFGKLLYHEKYPTQSEAMRRESEIKQLSRIEKEKLISKNKELHLQK